MKSVHRGMLNTYAGRGLFIGLCWLTLVAAKPVPQTANNKSVAPARQEMTLNFADADIMQVIEAVATRTGRNFIIDPRVKGKVTVISQKSMDANELYEVFLSVLKVHGYAAIPGKNATKIVPEVNAKQDAIETLSNRKRDSDSDAFVTQVLEVKHVDAAQLVPILRPLVPQRGHLAAYPASNVLIISDSAANISRIATIVGRIDQATGDEIEVIPLQHASATEIVRVITQLEGRGGKGKHDSSQVIADERTNSILLGGAVASRVRIRALISHLDTPMDTGGHTHVVYLKNAVAKDLVAVLTGVSKSVVSRKGKKAVAGGASSGNITIQADENTNALVINAPPDVFRSLRSVIQKLDIRRAQVLVEAVVAEVSSGTSTELGVQWAGDGSASDNPVGIIGFGNNPTAVAGLLEDPPFAAPVSGGLNLGLGKLTGTNKVAALINAISADTSNNILSTPTLVTLDNEEAEIVVGQNVPFITGQYSQTSTGSTSNPFTTVQRQDVGLKLKIKPQINEGNAVKLDVEQEVSSIANSTAGVDLITNKRSINTSVMVDDGQILVLGGLIEDVLREKEERVPLLGDIPILGWLFRYNSVSKDKTNLMVFLHPTILKDAAFSAKVTHDKYTYLRDQQLAIADRGVSFMNDDETPLLPDIKDFMVLPAPYQDNKTPSLNDVSAPPPLEKGELSE
ncbi:MAG: type II secretion system secretin GspD [Gammaproteobacteria bacterium]|nr:type II secretion system secretin GspD [Gammaproteobacteria bacterium]